MPISIDENWGTLMDFSFSDEQTLLQDSIERFIQNDYPFAARQKAIKQDPGHYLNFKFTIF